MDIKIFPIPIVPARDQGPCACEAHVKHTTETCRILEQNITLRDKANKINI